MLGSLGSMALVATMVTQSGGSGHRSVLAAGAFLLGTLAFVLVQLDRQRVRRTRRRDHARRGYLRHLADVRRRLRASAAMQRDRLAGHHPPPGTLPQPRRPGPRLRAGRRPSRRAFRVGTRGPPAPDRRADPGAGDDEPDPAALDALGRLLVGPRQVPASR